MSFINKIVVVTGAASGLGESIAFHFAKLSARLALVDSSVNPLIKSADNCERASKTKVFKVVADLTIAGEVHSTVDKIVEHYGRIDVLVYCSEINKPGNIFDFDVMEKYDEAVAINLRAAVLVTNKIASALIESKGSIIYISSVTSVKILSNSLHYGLTKAGLCHLTKSVAAELATNGVRANAILPGAVCTNLLLDTGVVEKLDDSGRCRDYVANLAPLMRISSADEISALVSFLASEKAIGITGVDYVIDNGMILGF